MKKNLSVIFWGILSLLFLYFAFSDWSNWLSLFKDILIVAICLFLAISKSKAINHNEPDDDERDQYVERLADHQVITIMEWLSLTLFIIFMLIYQFDGENLVIGVIAIIAILYWTIINILRLSVTILNNIRN